MKKILVELFFTNTASAEVIEVEKKNASHEY